MKIKTKTFLYSDTKKLDEQTCIYILDELIFDDKNECEEWKLKITELVYPVTVGSLLVMNKINHFIMYYDSKHQQSTHNKIIVKKEKSICKEKKKVNKPNTMKNLSTNVDIEQERKYWQRRINTDLKPETDIYSMGFVLQ
jgi:hypothetical protein